MSACTSAWQLRQSSAHFCSSLATALVNAATLLISKSFWLGSRWWKLSASTQPQYPHRSHLPPSSAMQRCLMALLFSEVRSALHCRHLPSWLRRVARLYSAIGKGTPQPRQDFCPSTTRVDAKGIRMPNGMQVKQYRRAQKTRLARPFKTMRLGMGAPQGHNL
jgi:hypothetical protein